ncbi:hypothetical protein JQ575_13560 [Bradyrhizobium sp. JYMT SZCCT0428]|nr:hypothetical protein [Bradyrhizobium sp. JYMT SZCCT0428]
MKDDPLGAHAFRVAARPSLDLSLLQAANTRKVVLHSNGRKATLFEGVRAALTNVRVGSKTAQRERLVLAASSTDRFNTFSVPLNLEAPVESSTHAAFNGCRCLVKIEQRRKASLFTGVDPINDYSDRVEAALALCHVHLA